jgi:hypothetical protein
VSRRAKVAPDPSLTWEVPTRSEHRALILFRLTLHFRWSRTFSGGSGAPVSVPREGGERGAG